MMRLGGVCALAMLGMAACQTAPSRPAQAPAAVVSVDEAEAWRSIASPGHSAAIEGLAAQWDRALAATRAGGLGRRVSAEGVLLVRGGALERAAPAPGPYRCRYVRLGARRWTASASAFCYVGVQNGQLSLATELRGLRLGGYLFETKGERSLVFLGAAVPAGAKNPGPYGDDPAADAVGTVERIGDFRYRLALPGPSDGAAVTIVEMVAAPGP